MATKYGIISDADRKTPLSWLLEGLSYLKKRRVDALLFTGEVGNLEHALHWCTNMQMPVYMIPGSHESVPEWVDVSQYFIQESPYVHDGVSEKFVDNGDHHLVFVPGSELTAGGGGFYMTTEGQTGIRFQHGSTSFFFNVNDIYQTVQEPEKTIIIAHMPPRLEGNYAGDRAYFGETHYKDDKGHIHSSIVPGYFQELRNHCLLPEERINLQKTNRGHVGLRQVIHDIWQNSNEKVVHGNFEESTHKACDRNGIPVPQKRFVNNLYWMASSLDINRAGILYVNSNSRGIQTAYENIIFPL